MSEDGFGAAVTAMLVAAGAIVIALPSVALVLPKFVSPV